MKRLVLVALGLGCVGGDGEKPEAIGLPPAWTSGTEWTIDPEPVLRLGAIGGDRADVFEDVTQAILLPNGRVAVADNGSAAIKVFDATGELVASFGRKGEGPGEFLHLSLISAYRQDSILALDARRSLVSVWSTDGHLARTIRLPSVTRTRPPLALPDGRFLVARARPRGLVTSGRRPPGMGVDTVRPLIFDPDGELVDSLPPLPLDPWAVGSDGAPTMAFFAPRASIAVGVGQLYWGWPERFEITVLDLSGRVLEVMSRPHERVRATAGDRTRFIDAVVGPDDRSRRMYESAVFGEWLPAFATSPTYPLQIDAEGVVWVPSFEFGLEPPTRWTVFAADGTFLGEVAAVPDLQIRGIDSDRVVGLIRDEFDVQYVQIHNILKSDSGSF